jgi:hypothetical protein
MKSSARDLDFSAFNLKTLDYSALAISRKTEVLPSRQIKFACARDDPTRNIHSK